MIYKGNFGAYFDDYLLQRLFYSRIKTEFFSSTTTFLRVVHLDVEAGQVKPTTSLTPLLSQLHVNISEFCSQCNLMTSKFIVGFPLGIDLLLYPDRIFKIFIRPVSVTFLVENYFDRDVNFNKFLSALNLYKIFLILKCTRNINNDRSIFRSFLGSLRTFNNMFIKPRSLY